ncbi:MAG: helix-hairpin-helix domain-containing protein [Eubacterium sp.]|nr:helix-hairpin-helix domain-containing protein [Eubacterium sp.]
MQRYNFKYAEYVLKAAGCLFLLGMLLIFETSCGENELKIETVKEQATSTDSITETFDSDGNQDKTSDDIICVYICGAVINEGVYELEADSRIRDVLDMAGGYSETAAHGYINLAEKLTDGEKIYVPTQEELDSGYAVPQISSGGVNPEGETAGESGTTNAGGIGSVNLNSAGVEELTALPGIGEGKAREIIRYRETNGLFNSIEDIKNVSGIGDATYEKIKDLLSL